MATDTIVRVDPKTLLVGPNVRKEIELPKEFIASIKEHGVLVPIVAHETKEGLEVVDGQMRTLAAVDAGVSDVPVFVRSVSKDAARIVDQLVVNRDRNELSRADTVAAVRQLTLDFKMPATAIAKKVGIPKAQVEQVVAIAGSETATAALESGITLDLAAKMAEAGLSKSEAKRVVEHPYNREHVLQQIVDERAEATATKDLEASVKAAGVQLVARPTPQYSNEPKNKHRYVVDLVDKVTGERIDDHSDCPGHAAFVGKRGGYNYNEKVEIRFVCTDPSKYGHRDANKTPPKPLTEAEKAERAANSAIAKLWPAIVRVRQTWLREQLLTRKTMPAGWEKIPTWVALEQAGTGGSWDWGPVASEFLGNDDRGYNASQVVKWLEANPTKPSTALLASALARIELSVGDSKSFKGWQGRKIAEYLELLASWGYGLSETEQSIVDGAKKGKSASS